MIINFTKRAWSYLIRIDEPKIKNNKKFLLRVILFTSFKTFNLFRWIKAYLIISKVISLSEFYEKLYIFWHRGNEGHTQQSSEQTKYLCELVVNKKRIFEIGFNGGHSSETFLKNNLKVQVVSNDIGWHFYTKFGEFYLNRKYKNRFELIYGDSKEVVPLYSQKYPKKFDLIYVDGGHSYTDAFNDIKNCKMLSSKYTTLLVDDVLYEKNNNLTHISEGPSKAWIKLLENDFIEHLDQVKFNSDGHFRTFVIGRYNFN